MRSISVFMVACAQQSRRGVAEPAIPVTSIESKVRNGQQYTYRDVPGGFGTGAILAITDPQTFFLADLIT